MKIIRKLSVPLLLTVIVLLLHQNNTLSQKYYPFIPRKTQDNFNIKIWRTEDGLPQNAVISILQDSKGFLWAGTQNGAVKYDGIKFTSLDFQKWFPALTRYVTSLFEDRNGNMLIATSGGGFILSTAKGHTLYTTGNGLFSNYCNSFFNDSRERIWIETTGGLNYFYKGKIHKIFDSNSNPFYLRPKFEDSTKCVWFLDSRGKIYIENNNEFTLYKSSLLADKKIDEIFCDKDKNIWAADDNRLYLLTGEKISYFNLPKFGPPIKIKKIIQDESGTLWLATAGSGILLFKDYAFHSFSTENGMSDNLIGDIFCDIDNNIWVGTYSGGLIRLSQKSIETLSSFNGLPNDFIFSVQYDRAGNLWLGTYGGGLIKFDGSKFTQFDRTTGFPHSIIRTVLLDSKGNLLVGTYGRGLVFIDEEGKTIKAIDAGLPSQNIYALLEDSKNNYWIGTGSGLVRFKDGEIQNFDNHAFKPGMMIRSLEEDSGGDLWIATDIDGVWRYNGSDFINYTIDDGLPSNSIKDISIDSHGLLWFSTVNGICVYNKGEFKKIILQSELDNEVIYSSVEDPYGNLWLSSNYGIIQITSSDVNRFLSNEISTVFPIFFNKSHGMIESECNGGNKPSGILTAEGKLIFPTIKGVVVIDPALISMKKLNSKNIIEKFTAGDEIIDVTDEIILSAGKNKFEISYTAPYLTYPDRIQFKYRLVGYDNDWINASKRRTAFYDKVPPGEYKFQLISRCDNGEWTREPAEISIIINPYFYETVWFFILIALSIIAGLVLYMRWRHRKIIAEQKKLQNLVDERTHSLNEEKKRAELALAEIESARNALDAVNRELVDANKLKTDLLNIAAHDLRNPLNVIKGCCDLIMDEEQLVPTVVESMELIKRSSDKMLTLVDEVLKTSNHDNTKLHLSCTDFDISALLETVVNNFKNLAAKKRQNIIYSNPGELFITADEIKLEEVFSNLISNAVKYSPYDKNIYVEIKPNTDEVKIIFKDQGPGLTEEDKQKLFGKFQRLSAQPTGNESSTGLGLSIVKEFVDLHNGRIDVESSPGEGSVFIIFLPRKNS